MLIHDKVIIIIVKKIKDEMLSRVGWCGYNLLPTAIRHARYWGTDMRAATCDKNKEGERGREERPRERRRGRSYRREE